MTWLQWWKHKILPRYYAVVYPLEGKLLNITREAFLWNGLQALHDCLIEQGFGKAYDREMSYKNCCFIPRIKLKTFDCEYYAKIGMVSTEACDTIKEMKKNYGIL